MLFYRALTRYLAGANSLKNIIQQLNFGITDADGKLMVFVAVFPAQGNSAFSVDQARNIGCISRRKGVYCSVGNYLWFSLLKIAPTSCRGYRVGGGGGTAYPNLSEWAGLYLHPVARMRGVLFTA